MNNNPTADDSTAENLYTVQPGDTLWDIAQRHNVPLADLIGANQQIENPDLIFPGQRISIPGVGGAIADTAVASGTQQSTTYQHAESTGQSATPTPTSTETPGGTASQPQQTENVTPAQPAVTEAPAQEPTPAAVDVNPDNSSAANPVDTVTVTEGS